MLSQPIEVPTAREQLRISLGRAGAPQMDRRDRTDVKEVSRRLVVELVVVVLTSFHAGLPSGDSYAQAWRSVTRHPLLILHILVGAVVLAEAVILSSVACGTGNRAGVSWR
jgi:hypothetical protein